jgi:predicted nucleic acid-binding protein
MIIDSNIFISLFRKHELLHDKAKKLFFDLNEIIITDEILGEVYTVILMKENYKVAREILYFLLNESKIKILSLSEKEKTDIRCFLLKNNTKLSFVDVSLLIFSKSRNLELKTFDKDLVKAY